MPGWHHRTEKLFQFRQSPLSMNLYGGCKRLNKRRKETPHFNVALVNTCSSMPSYVRFRCSIIFLPRFHTSSSLSLAFFFPPGTPPERLIYYRKSLVNIFIIGFFSPISLHFFLWRFFMNQIIIKMLSWEGDTGISGNLLWNCVCWSIK